MTTTHILLVIILILLATIMVQTYKLNYIFKVSKRTDMFITEMAILVNKGLEEDEKLRIPDPTPNPTPDVIPN